MDCVGQTAQAGDIRVRVNRQLPRTGLPLRRDVGVLGDDEAQILGTGGIVGTELVGDGAVVVGSACGHRRHDKAIFQRQAADAYWCLQKLQDVIDSFFLIRNSLPQEGTLFKIETARQPQPPGRMIPVRSGKRKSGGKPYGALTGSKPAGWPRQRRRSSCAGRSGGSLWRRPG